MRLRPVRSGQGANSAQLRQFNERAVLQYLRRLGEASKADLARAAGLTNNAIGMLIRELEELGLVRDLGKKREGRRGQPATLLSLDPRGAFSIGVRLDRGRTEVVLCDFNGTLLARHSHEIVLPPPEEALEIVAGDVRHLITRLSDEDRPRLTGIGLAQPFNLGAWLRELELPRETFARWDEVDFAAMLQDATGVEVFLENDGNAAAIAELLYGTGREEDDFLYLFIGPAIGGGIVLGGDCLRGAHGNAADVAVMPVPPSELASVRDHPLGDILIARASLNSLFRHLRWSGVAVPDQTAFATTVAAASGRADGPVAEWIEDCVAALSVSVRSIVATIDVPTVVIDSDLHGWVLDAIVTRLTERLAADMAEARTPPRLVHGRFGSDAGALGAAAVPLFFNFAPRSSLLTGAGGAYAEEAKHVAAE
ncbi:ROK family transcriptional regulator [Segnochrobactrum spirostomi]|uniref:ROK family transcriptional regulator n=1 Tax=Segnochrobactrum spirostomi TaxID=2608987 RepID=UPI0028AA31F3|nr:ROK family transcriptional regulator [Segnochrobactrum spirostomi]